MNRIARIFIFFVSLHLTCIEANAIDSVFNAYQEGNFKELIQYINSNVKDASIDVLKIKALLHIEGIRFAKDIEIAKSYFQKAATLKDGDSLYFLGKFAFEGIGEEVNYRKAFNYFRDASNVGNANADNMLGIMYGDGLYVEQNFEKAFKYFDKAANGGYLDANVKIAIMHYRGDFLKKDIEKACSILNNVANQGSIRAMRVLSKLYLENENIHNALDISNQWKNRADKLEADEITKRYFNSGYFQIAIDKAVEVAKNGNKIAAFYIWKYYESLGTPKELLSNALNWLFYSANEGYFLAQAHLAWFYYEGYIVEKDINESNSWAMKALDELNQKARYNDAESLYNLAVLYFYGIGVSKSLVKAEELTEKSLVNGYEGAKKLKEEINRKKSVLIRFKYLKCNKSIAIVL